MLHIIGIGLSDPTDISEKGLKTIKEADQIYLENYTSKLQAAVEELEEFYKTDITPLDRKAVEQETEILEKAKDEKVALLIMGDAFSATTHFEIYKTAKEKGINVKVIHNASILTAVSITGLQLYKFGRTASIPFRNKKVTTPYDILEDNRAQGLHTLFLLDLNPGEDNFMTVPQAIEYLLRTEEEQGRNAFSENTLCVGCARLGSEDFKVKSGNAKNLIEEDFGEPPHCLAVPGKMHFTEEEALEMWS